MKRNELAELILLIVVGGVVGGGVNGGDIAIYVDETIGKVGRCCLCRPCGSSLISV